MAMALISFRDTVEQLIAVNVARLLIILCEFCTFSFEPLQVAVQLRCLRPHKDHLNPIPQIAIYSMRCLHRLGNMGKYMKRPLLFS